MLQVLDQILQTVRTDIINQGTWPLSNDESDNFVDDIVGTLTNAVRTAGFDITHDEIDHWITSQIPSLAYYAIPRHSNADLAKVRDMLVDVETALRQIEDTTPHCVIATLNPLRAQLFMTPHSCKHTPPQETSS